MDTNKNPKADVFTIQLFRRLLFYFLVFTFIIIFALRVQKLTSQETGLSSKYEPNHGMPLPSFTFCFGFQKDGSTLKKFEINPDFTFADYMESLPSMKNYLYRANFYHESPMMEKTGIRVNILEEKFSHLWEESFYLQSTLDYYGINRCLTLNSPEEKLGRYKNLEVNTKFLLN